MNTDLTEAETRLIGDLRKSRKYRDLCDETLERIAHWALARNPSVKGATKAAKRKLHQVYGAYVGQVDVDEILRLVDQIDQADPRPICEKVLRMHVSTAERLDELENVFRAIWQATGHPLRVMDLACGLNPFVLPWMGKLEAYLACDIDMRLAHCIGKFFENIAFDGVSVCHDLLTTVPSWQADVVFLLKVLPCLEQQEKGASLALLKRLQAPSVVVSFPTQSIGGQEKGMEAHYEGFMSDLVQEWGGQMERLVFAREVYYVLRQ